MQIYLITNLENGKQYVGQTIHTAELRFNKHCYGGYDMVISRAIKKYGVDKFSLSVLCDCSDIDELNEKEEFYISELKTLIPNGYNVALGGKNKTMNEDTKQKISKANKGIKKSKEHVEKVKESNLKNDPNHYKNLYKFKKGNPFVSGQRKNLSKGKASKSKYVGVTVDKKSFRAEFYFKGERKCLSFTSEEAAAHCYDYFCSEKGIEAINFPEDPWGKSKIDNLRSLPKKRESLFYGVKETRPNHWQSLIWLNGKANYIGTFETEQIAAKAVDDFLIQNGKSTKNEFILKDTFPQ